MRFLKKMLIPVVVLIIGFWLWGLKVPTEEYDLVIYGGGLLVVRLLIMLPKWSLMEIFY